MASLIYPVALSGLRLILTIPNLGILTPNWWRNFSKLLLYLQINLHLKNFHGKNSSLISKWESFLKATDELW